MRSVESRTVPFRSVALLPFLLPMLSPLPAKRRNASKTIVIVAPCADYTTTV
jgi:hypothetical protein